ncbi:MAG TPA: hypothetical protein VF193_12010 [Steroidobacter sp.]
MISRPHLLKQLALLSATVLTACGGLPKYEKPMKPSQSLGYDWRNHFDYGLEMLRSNRLEQHKAVFARAAFSSAARFSQDHAPSYAGLGLAELNLGNFSEAQIAFMNAALIEDRSMYWALSAIAALRSGAEVVARTLFDAMQAAATQDDDPATRFIRAVYSPEDQAYPLPLRVIPHALGSDGVNEDLVCTAENRLEEPACRNLNIMFSVYFVRRYVSDATTRGAGFFNDLVFRLGAAEGDNFYQYERIREHGSEFDGDEASAHDTILRTRQLLLRPHLSIPDIEYAMRFMPLNLRSSVYLNAAPAVVASIGEASEIRDGSDLTIMLSGGVYGDASEHTAQTGTSLSVEPELATPEYVKLKLEFELSSVSTLEPGVNAQVLNVSTNKYSIAGHFPYGKPVVLGKLSNGSQKYDDSGQVGLRRTPAIGGAFGASREEVATSETLVLGVLSEPAAFRGSQEKRVLDAMRTMGIATPEYATIERRKILHRAPDVSVFLLEFLEQQSEAVE